MDGRADDFGVENLHSVRIDQADVSVARLATAALGSAAAAAALTSATAALRSATAALRFSPSQDEAYLRHSRETAEARGRDDVWWCGELES